MVRLQMSDGKDGFIGTAVTPADANRMITAFSEWLETQPDGTRLVITSEAVPDPVPSWAERVIAVLSQIRAMLGGRSYVQRQA